MLIGHAGDPRLWHCPAETRHECAQRFVIDRVVWLSGEFVDLAAPDQRVTTAMVPEEAVAAAQGAGEPIAVIGLRAGDAPTIDPRLHGVGDSIVWVVRTLRSTDVSDADPTRAVDVTLVEDATGEVLAAESLAMDATFQPAIVMVQATTIGNGNDIVYPVYRVELPDGTGVQQMLVGGSASSDNRVTRHGPGMAALLEAGDYVVRAWLARIDRQGRSGEPQDECSTEISVDAPSTVRLEAAFPASGPCVFVVPTFETVFDQ